MNVEHYIRWDPTPADIDQEGTPVALDKTIEQYQDYFYEAGFDEWAIDLTYVPEEVVILLGETLRKRSIERKIVQKTAAMQKQPKEMEFLLQRKVISPNQPLEPFRMISCEEDE